MKRDENVKEIEKLISQSFSTFFSDKKYLSGTEIILIFIRECDVVVSLCHVVVEFPFINSAQYLSLSQTKSVLNKFSRNPLTLFYSLKV